jgi:hypothetical protein
MSTEKQVEVLTEVIGNEDTSWKIVKRVNPAMHFPSDFALLKVQMDDPPPTAPGYLFKSP